MGVGDTRGMGSMGEGSESGEDSVTVSDLC